MVLATRLWNGYSMHHEMMTDAIRCQNSKRPMKKITVYDLSLMSARCTTTFKHQSLSPDRKYNNYRIGEMEMKTKMVLPVYRDFNTGNAMHLIYYKHIRNDGQCYSAVV